MRALNKGGGIAAMAIAVSYIFGFALFLGVIDSAGYEGPDGALAYVIDQQALLSFAIAILYPLAACALGVLVVTLRRRAELDGWSEVAALFGGIWAALLFASGFVGIAGMQSVIKLAATEPETARAAWAAISTVQDALGGGIELVGGLWMAMVSWLAMRERQMPRALGWLGIVVGGFGIATLAPPLTDLASAFGIGQIVWFAWLGAILLRDQG